MSLSPTDTPEFMEVDLPEGRAMIPFEEAVTRPEMAAQVVQQALAEADQWHRRYAAFLDRIDDRAACEIARAIEHVRNVRDRSEDEEEGGLAMD